MLVIVHSQLLLVAPGYNCFSTYKGYVMQS